MHSSREFYLASEKGDSYKNIETYRAHTVPSFCSRGRPNLRNFRSSSRGESTRLLCRRSKSELDSRKRRHPTEMRETNKWEFKLQLSEIFQQCPPRKEVERLGFFRNSIIWKEGGVSSKNVDGKKRNSSWLIRTSEDEKNARKDFVGKKIFQDGRRTENMSKLLSLHYTVSQGLVKLMNR